MGLGTGGLRAQVVEVDTEPLTGDRPRGFLHFDASDRRLHGYAWDFPTVVDGEPLVCRGVYLLKIGEYAIDVGAYLDERLQRMGIYSSRATQKRYAERGFEPATCLATGAGCSWGRRRGSTRSRARVSLRPSSTESSPGAFLARMLGGRGPVDLTPWREEVSSVTPRS